MYCFCENGKKKRREEKYGRKEEKWEKRGKRVNKLTNKY